MHDVAEHVAAFKVWTALEKPETKRLKIRAAANRLRGWSASASAPISATPRPICAARSKACARRVSNSWPCRRFTHKALGRQDQPDFINACALARTLLDPCALLDLVQSVEHEIGRRRSLRWGPRPIDIDILFYEDVSSADPRLPPTPRLTQRAFVLRPLAEIAPEMVVGGLRLADAAQKFDPSGVVRVSSFDRRLNVI